MAVGSGTTTESVHATCVSLGCALCLVLILLGCGKSPTPKKILNFPYVAGAKLASVIEPELQANESILVIASWEEEHEPPFATAFQAGMKEGLGVSPVLVHMVNIAIL